MVLYFWINSWAIHFLFMGVFRMKTLYSLQILVSALWCGVWIFERDATGLIIVYTILLIIVAIYNTIAEVKGIDTQNIIEEIYLNTRK